MSTYTFMEKKFVSLFTILIGCILLLNSCKKEETIESVNTGKTSFWCASDLGSGDINVVVEGQAVGAITHYNASGISCGSSDVNIEKMPGTYTWSAQGNSNTTWGGTLTITAGECSTIELTAGGGSNGGVNITPTTTTPSNFFVANQDYTVSSQGSYWTEQITISATSSFIFRFASQYQAQAAIITPDQLANFTNHLSFTGFAIFDNQFGTNYVTLSPGSYYVAVRNTSNGANKWSVELDYAVSLPPSDHASFVDNYITGVKSWNSSSRYWHAFTIQTGYRYFMDGCNVNSDVHLITADQLTAFQNGGTYQYLSNYYDVGGAAPGFWELHLNPGDYYLISYNTQPASLTYVLERWRIN
jgi:hypothetical protein